MVDASIVVVLKAHVEEDDEGRHAPTHLRVVNVITSWTRVSQLVHAHM